jgi:hypothetical protein
MVKCEGHSIDEHGQQYLAARGIHYDEVNQHRAA